MSLRAASLALVLAGLRRQGGTDGPTLAEAAARLSRSGRVMVFPLLAGLGMVPSPGLPLGAVCGTLILWLALGCLLDRPARPLPSRLGGMRLSPRILDAALRRLIVPLRRLEKLTRPRWTALTLPSAAWLSIMGQGLVMALPIPFGNVLPGISIIVLAVALLRQDGVGAALGHILGVLSLALLLGLGWGLAVVV